MITYRLMWIVCSCALLLLSSCGTASGQTSGSGTQSGGPVSIATDNSAYAPDGQIQVSVHNALSTPIYALDTQASCSILGLEVLTQGAWQASSAAHCPLGRPAGLVKIAPGQSYTATIRGTISGSPDATLPSGTYRLVLNYTTTADIMSIQSHPQITTSGQFTVN